LDAEIFKMSDAEVKFANLQFRYTELLEKRIAQLEAALASPVAISKPADATADTDEKDTDKKDSDDESSDDEKEKKDVRIIALPMLNSEHCDK
jgi:hypothetical protein